MACEAFFNFLGKYIPVSELLKRRIVEVSGVKVYSAREIIQEPGTYCKYFRYVVKGGIRYYTNFDGREITTWFEFENYLAIPFDSFFMQKLGFEYMQALEETHMLEISYDDYQQLYDDFPEMDRFGRLWLEQESAFQVDFFKYFNYLTAAQRYSRLLEYEPRIEQKVKLTHIASFLGIAPETLSRVRSNFIKG